MELWYSEDHSENVKFWIRFDRQLYSGRSDYQRIDVFESDEFGRVLTLDGYLMLTERDEFIYHEMITHVPMAVRPDIRDVLVIGAGDGGAVRELVRYGGIRRVDVAEIDPAVVEVCREYLPSVSCGFDDSRVALHYQDGLRFVRGRESEYDLIIVDSTDPFGPGEVLFTREFYGSCHKALRDGGIMVNQHESPFYAADADAMKRAHSRIYSSFELCRVYHAHIPTYPSGYWLFGFASKGMHPVRGLDADAWNALGLRTRYYNTKLHAGAFCLPTYVEEMLRSAERGT
ncbi:MAG: polyamine aminopropyltransferase [Oscillospiraceae bacterium]|jgi:spermidine synthase|nr:polyamine aminopropyltransferase [Oscillospiraceae bacterium]